MTILRRLLGLLCLLCATSIGLAATAQQTLQAHAYQGWWLPEGWRTLGDTSLQRIYFFHVAIEADGTLPEKRGWPEQWRDFQFFAASRQIPVELTLTLFNADVFHRLFSNPAAIDRLLDQANALVQLGNLAGLHLDVEIYTQLESADIAAYKRFVRSLSQQLQAQQPPKALSVFLPFPLESALYDATTVQDLHHVVLQGYDAHSDDSQTAGPLAPLDGPYALTWKNLTKLADQMGIERAKQFLSYPLYGYEWRVKKGNGTHRPSLAKGQVTHFARTVTDPGDTDTPPINITQRVAKFGSVFDPVTASSYYQFRDAQGQDWEGWYDDWWGLLKKKNYLVQENLGGIAFFLLGYDDGILVSDFTKLPTASINKLPTTPGKPKHSGLPPTDR